MLQAAVAVGQAGAVFVILPYGMCTCSGWCSCGTGQQWQPTESGCDPQGWTTLLFLQILFSQDP